MNKENMTAQNTKLSSWIETIESFERLIFYASLFVLPLSIIPLPWDITELSMGVVMLFFSSILLTIEFVKLIWRGRILVPKAAVDLGIMYLIGSIALSTIFSQSIQSSLWGFDFRLGSGFVSLLVSAIYLYSVRSFLFKYEEIIYGFKFFIAGSIFSAIFSIFSFFGMNILSFSQPFNSLFTTGLPFYSSSRISVVVWGFSLVLSIFFAITSINKKKLPFALFSIVSSIVYTVAIFLFTLAQGWQLSLLFVLSIGALFFYIGFNTKHKLNRAANILMYSFVALVVVSFCLSLIPYIRTGVGNLSKTLVTQVTISSEISLKIITQALSQSIQTGLFGLGHDTFSIAYNQFRPLSEETVSIISTNFTNANNQMYTVLSNRGLVGFSVWLVLGYILGKYVYENFKMNKLENEQELSLLVIDMLSVSMYLTSLFVFHNFLLTFLILLCVSMSVALRNMVFKDKLDVYVLNFGMFTHTSGNVAMKNSTIAATVLVVALGIFLNISALRIGISGVYALKAETITAQIRNSQDLEEDKKIEQIESAANNYSTAIRYNQSNDVLHRRAAILISQYLEILAKRYNSMDDANLKKSLFERIATYVEIAVEESKRATDLSPKVFANWSTRSTVYSKLVGLGLTSYTKSALTALQNSAQLNPLNYEVYYNAAQLYILNNESDTALRTLNQLFSINPKHIPSLILAGEISFKDKDYKQAKRYFGDAKKVMEETNSTTNDIYEYVNKKLGEIEQVSPTEVPQTPKPETKTEEKKETNEVQK